MVIRFGRAMLYLLLALIAFTTLFPFLNVLASSLSSSRAIVSGEVTIFPVEFNWDAYANLLRDGQLFRAMKNTAIITGVGVVLQITATTLAAYPLSKRRLQGRGIMLALILFTMLFGGGLIPLFLVLKALHTLDTYWAIWLPGLISTYNLFVMKTFFEELPIELEESASMDGAGDITVLLRVCLPVSKAIIAALSLFYAVGLWNTYSSALFFLTSSDKMPLVIMLYQMIQSPAETLLAVDSSDTGVVQPEALKAAAIIIAMLPILCVYPFVQRHFVKGMLIGSVKG
ncbi:carbohydrate ABC transporter permease [Paenibacillus methanolicus]|uniref:Putative aldouronate transport system permease protein n=1 Tax=Paenibacillus methanolicus TaxID=582686 RepID=A0A5S5CLL2_9BACL|nr:carbohydrate ABC transporter permease [Paenibacillus methanolicus]TYP79278.1 putative aldouronate transport system permease protein [Paenibacillus methanolicus]